MSMAILVLHLLEESVKSKKCLWGNMFLGIACFMSFLKVLCVLWACFVGQLVPCTGSWNEASMFFKMSLPASRSAQEGQLLCLKTIRPMLWRGVQVFLLIRSLRWNKTAKSVENTKITLFAFILVKSWKGFAKKPLYPTLSAQLVWPQGRVGEG